jgi:RNA polymerase sigma factor (sigma-70 family)
MKGFREFDSVSDLSTRPEEFERPESYPESQYEADSDDDHSISLSSGELVTEAVSAEIKLRNPLRAYGEFVGRYPLLTDQEEFEYGMQLLQGRDAIEGTTARERLRLHNLRLPFAVAQKYTFNDEDALECIQIGNEELFRAIDKFDPHKGKRVADLAYKPIKGAITRHVTRGAFPVQPPEKLFKKVEIMEALQDSASNTTKEDFAEVARIKPESVDETIATIKRFLAQFGKKYSLDAAIEATKSNAISLEDTIGQSTFPVPGENTLWRLAEDLLRPEEQVIVRLRLEFGMKHREIGALLHRSRQSTSETYARAINKLRRAAA